MFLFSVLVLISTLFFLFFGSFIYAADPFFLDASSILMPPSSAHPFGTDRLGRDLLARMIEGGQVSVIIGFSSSLLTILIALMVGFSAGYFRGTIDKIVLVVIDLFLTFPTFFLLLALVSYMNASVFVLVFIISITGWMGSARLLRSESFKIVSQPYIKILKMANVKKSKILFKYFTPMLAPIVLTSFTFGVGGAILAESGLSFLGLGVTAPQVSWGTLLSDGKEVIEIAWWVSFFPGFMIFLITFALINISNKLQKSTR